MAGLALAAGVQAGWLLAEQTRHQAFRQGTLADPGRAMQQVGVSMLRTPG
jgi:hypothetical protein